jgi:urease accessory protein
MKLKVIFTALMTLIALLVTPYAVAHGGVIISNGLADGFMHPAAGLDHLVIAIAAGFWAARSGDHGVQDMTYFLSLLLVGLLLGVFCLQFPQLELSTMLLVMLIAAFVAMSIAAPQYIGYVFFGGLAIYHGITHILEIPALITITGYIIGLLLSTGLLLMLGTMLRQVVVTHMPHGRTTR